ncbi:MAG: hypothetical protein WAQ99_08620 [Pyrinomonadaceae bacterium]
MAEEHSLIQTAAAVLSSSLIATPVPDKPRPAKAEHNRPALLLVDPKFLSSASGNRLGRINYGWQSVISAQRTTFLS